jgi:hypothetical protein
VARLGASGEYTLKKANVDREQERLTEAVRKVLADLGIASARPAYCTIPDWCAMTGMSPKGTYRAIGAGHLEAVKIGPRTHINVEAGLRWLASLPRAEIRAGRKPELEPAA